MNADQAKSSLKISDVEVRYLAILASQMCSCDVFLSLDTAAGLQSCIQPFEAFYVLHEVVLQFLNLFVKDPIGWRKSYLCELRLYLSVNT
jgi:hypothetical protein